MSYDTTDLLAGGLIVACVLLLLCWSRKPEGMTAIPGLKFKSGYTSGPTYGRFHREGYGIANTTGYLNTNRFEGMEGLADDDAPVKSLNNLETRATPSSMAVSKPTGKENNMQWESDAGIGVDVFNRTNSDLESGARLSEKDNENLYDLVFTQSANKMSTPMPRSLGGAIMNLTDYSTVPSRQVTI